MNFSSVLRRWLVLWRRKTLAVCYGTKTCV